MNLFGGVREQFSPCPLPSETMRRATLLCLLLCCSFAVLAVACDPEEAGGGGSGGGSSAALTIDPATLPDPVEGAAYSEVLTATGSAGPFSWALAAGSLPPGLALDLASVADTTTLSGTPTLPGSFSFTVIVTDGALAGARSYNMNVQAATTGGLTIITATLPGAVVLQPYTAQLQASGAAGPLNWSITGGVLPVGIAMDAAGLVSGSATVTGNWPVTITVDDGTATASRAYVLNVGGVPGNAQLEQQLRQLIAAENIAPMNQPPAPPAAQVDLGRLLFFDKELSGNRDVACATCHHPTLGTGDKLNLSIGVGGTGGIGPGRDHPAKVFIARNAQPILNVAQIPEMFWDKRVGIPPPPPGQPPAPPGTPVQTPEGQMNLSPLAAQSLFPLTDLIEMRGTGHSLDGLNNTDYRLALVNRLAQFPAYTQGFDAAFGPGNMNVNNMARAIAAWEASQTFTNSAWDRYLRGDSAAMTDPQKRGAQVFFGRGNCDGCHNGPQLSNFSTHNLGIPQFGPGKGNGTSGREDFGFENTTGNTANRYQFRVPPLRNVAFTAPYMHNGAFETLDEVLVHYRDKAASSGAYTGANITQAADLAPTLLPVAPMTQNLSPVFLNVPGNLTPNELADLKAFLEALTDPAAINRTQEVPQSVPSGLPVDR
ncbi:MAG: putative Ig domain-containing protein [Planctomycetes bacterium]|nr:putative Ig domain-containing protein [Planctomycetota bacterium]